MAVTSAVMAMATRATAAWAVDDILITANSAIRRSIPRNPPQIPRPQMPNKAA
jgi:hypothetical protein